jgi:RecA-family ATPase
MTWGTEEFFETEDAAAREQAAKPNGATIQQPGEPLITIDPADLADASVPPRQWLVPDWIPMARATALNGAGGEGKTLLAQMLATACAIGREWLGLRVLRCKSLLQFCEDDLDEMHRRQEDINRFYGCTFADLGAMRWLPRLGYDNALMVFNGGRAQRSPLFEQLLSAARAHEASLIICDTLADIFTGNENDRGQARTFTQQALGLLARETRGAVVALAHPSRTGMNSGSGESGSTAWIGTFRSLLYLATPRGEGSGADAEPADPDLRTLTRRKANTARRNEMIELRWKDGVFDVTSPPAGIIGSIERRTCERVFLDLLAR